LFFYAKEFPQAERMARQALSLKPDDIEAMEQLFGALREQNKADESNRLMVKLLELQALKANKEISADIKHFKDVVSGVSMKTAPKKFVESHFDGYAPFFDEHLQNVLNYRTPEMLAEVLQPLALLKSGAPLSLLDLGCGTGLMAAALEANTALRVGVDLSQGMLERAREKELYDELHKADIVSFMQGDSRIFDLIVAADVFVYIGDLSPVFESAFKKLAPSGLFAFSIEVNEGAEPYLLNPADRYSHSVAYIENAVMQMGYELLINKDCLVRTENGNPVKGCVMVIRKPKKSN
jgi:predicted TPR repeat methyltransferase